MSTEWIQYQLPLESPIPPAAAPAPARPSQKASSSDKSGTKRSIIGPLVSKRPEKILNKNKKTSPQAKRHKLSLLFISLTILTNFDNF